MKVAVVGVGVVVEVAAVGQVLEEELVQDPKTVQVGCVGREAATNPLEQGVYLNQHLLHIELGVFVLGQAGGCF